MAKKKDKKKDEYLRYVINVNVEKGAHVTIIQSGSPTNPLPPVKPK